MNRNNFIRINLNKYILILNKFKLFIKGLYNKIYL